MGHNIKYTSSTLHMINIITLNVKTHLVLQSQPVSINNFTFIRIPPQEEQSGSSLGTMCFKNKSLVASKIRTVVFISEGYLNDQNMLLFLSSFDFPPRSVSPQCVIRSTWF